MMLNKVVQVEFEDSPRTLYSYFTGGLALEVGDLVVTPAPSAPGRFGYTRYNRQGIAAVIRFGRGDFDGPLKTLLGKVTTKSGKTKKARWYLPGVVHTQVSNVGYARQKKVLALGDTLKIGDDVFEIGDDARITIDSLVRRVRELERRLNNDRHTHFNSASPPRGIA